MIYTIVFSPESLDSLDEIEQYIIDNGSPLSATQYVDAIVDFCESLSTLPYRGVKREDILQGLYVTHYRKNTIIAYMVDSIAGSVSIVGVFHGGQDYGAILQNQSSS